MISVEEALARLLAPLEALPAEQQTAELTFAEIEGVIELKPNARVCLASDADRFLQLFVSRVKGK